MNIEYIKTKHLWKVHKNGIENFSNTYCNHKNLLFFNPIFDYRLITNIFLWTPKES